MKRKLITSGIVGNFLDAYDITIFFYMSYYISVCFFTAEDSITNIIKTFAIFAISHLIKPIGGLFFGVLGDSLGRKKAFTISLLLMGFATTMIGILPSYHTLGLCAIVLLLLMRALQSFSLGAEYTNSIVFLYEHASPKELVFTTSFVAVGFNLGTLIATLMGFSIVLLMQHNLLGAWGWRIPFLVAIAGTFLGMWVRNALPETMEFIRANPQRVFRPKLIFRQIIMDIKEHRSNYILLTALAWLGSSSTMLFYVYFPTHLSMIRGVPYSHSLLINAISIGLLIVQIPLFSKLADKWGKGKFIMVAVYGYAVIAFPYYLAISLGSLTSIIILQIGSSVFSAMLYGIAPAIIAESAPAAIRCTITSFVYSIVASIFGGTTPLIAMSLIKYTHLSYSPAFYLIASTIFTLVVLYKVKTVVKLKDCTHENMSDQFVF